jgi:hypothetical protein
MRSILERNIEKLRFTNIAGSAATQAQETTMLPDSRFPGGSSTSVPFRYVPSTGQIVDSGDDLNTKAYETLHGGVLTYVLYPKTKKIEIGSISLDRRTPNTTATQIIRAVTEFNRQSREYLANKKD